MLSIFDMFTIGVGPSSSHTVGPMRAASMFAHDLDADGLLPQVDRVTITLFGSLAATGLGHGSDRAVLAGLGGVDPATVDPQLVAQVRDRVQQSGQVWLLDRRLIDFDLSTDLIFARQALPQHPNALTLRALAGDDVLAERTYYSIGGGFIETDGDVSPTPPTAAVPHPFATCEQLLAICERTNLSIADVMRANELTWRSAAEVDDGVGTLWQAMSDCVEAGIATEGILPGGLGVRRRAPRLATALREAHANDATPDPFSPMDWLTTYALAVNEENAGGGRVVTAPTNGAAGVIPAVLYGLVHNSPERGPATPQRIADFLLTAAAFGMLIKQAASLSGAEVGCQGEVGSACAMAAAGLAAYGGGTPAQVENAAEIGMEHCLGLTCDPIGGLVQIPCIERNAMAACHAVMAARTALHGDGTHLVSFDEVVRTMKQTGLDMSSKYRETSRGGLAVNTTVC